MQNKPKKVLLSKGKLWGLFKKAYLLTSGYEFMETPDTLENIAPLIEYFLEDPRFLKRERLVPAVGGQELLPNFQKGLLIVGGHGNGKSSALKAFETLFAHYRMPNVIKLRKNHIASF